MFSMAPATPTWVEHMSLHRWSAISGDHPELGLPPTTPGTRYLIDTDPARDPDLNPARTIKERVRRTLGREPKSPWHGVAGFSAITEGWNGAAYASRYGASGSMIVFGGGHNDYFGSDVHAFDLASREWRRLESDQCLRHSIAAGLLAGPRRLCYALSETCGWPDRKSVV